MKSKQLLNASYRDTDPDISSSDFERYSRKTWISKVAVWMDHFLRFYRLMSDVHFASDISENFYFLFITFIYYLILRLFLSFDIARRVLSGSPRRSERSPLNFTIGFTLWSRIYYLKTNQYFMISFRLIFLSFVCAVFPFVSFGWSDYQSLNCRSRHPFSWSRVVSLVSVDTLTSSFHLHGPVKTTLIIFSCRVGMSSLMLHIREIGISFRLGPLWKYPSRRSCHVRWGFLSLLNKLNIIKISLGSRSSPLDRKCSSYSWNHFVSFHGCSYREYFWSCWWRCWSNL